MSFTFDIARSGSCYILRHHFMHHQMSNFMRNIETDTFCGLAGVYRHIRHTIEQKLKASTSRPTVGKLNTRMP